MKEILVLGTGCPRCKALHDRVLELVDGAGLDCTVTKVHEMQDIMKHGVLSVPAMVIDGQVLFSGTVPDDSDLKRMLGI